MRLSSKLSFAIFLSAIFGCASPPKEPIATFWELQKVEIVNSTSTGSEKGRFIFPMDNESIFDENSCLPDFQGTEQDLINYLNRFKSIQVKSIHDEYRVETSGCKKPSGCRVALSPDGLKIKINVLFQVDDFESEKQKRVYENKLNDFNRRISFGNYEMLYRQNILDKNK